MHSQDARLCSVACVYGAESANRQWDRSGEPCGNEQPRIALSNVCHLSKYHQNIGCAAHRRYIQPHFRAQWEQQRCVPSSSQCSPLWVRIPSKPKAFTHWISREHIPYASHPIYPIRYLFGVQFVESRRKEANKMKKNRSKCEFVME